MMEEVLDAPGGWEVDLRPDTPLSVTDRLNLDDYGWAQIIVTPCPVNIDTIGTDNLHKVAVYSGLYVRSENRTDRLSGPGLWAALGRADGVGPLVGAGLSATRSFRAWIENLDLDPFITADSSLDSGGSILWTSDRVMTYREAIESICDTTGKYAAGDHLFIDPRTMTIKNTLQPDGVSWREQRVYAAVGERPRLLITPGMFHPGREIGEGFRNIDAEVTVLPAVLERVRDTGEWLSDVTVTGASSTSTTAGSNAYTYPGGVDVNMTKYVNDGSITSNTSVANAELAAHNDAAVELAASTTWPNVLELVTPGMTTAYAFDPVHGLFSTAGTWVGCVAGQEMWPVPIQVQSVRAPIEPGMGVYMLRRIPAGDDAVNLTDWFVPETGPARIEFGRFQSRALRNVTRRAGARRQ